MGNGGRPKRAGFPPRGWSGAVSNRRPSAFNSTAFPVRARCTVAEQSPPSGGVLIGAWRCWTSRWTSRWTEPGRTDQRGSIGLSLR
jgi:hypothetical protein